MRNIFLLVLLAVANITFAQDGWHRLYNKNKVEDDFKIIDLISQNDDPYVMGYTMLENQPDTSAVFFTRLNGENGKIVEQLSIDTLFGKNVTGAFSRVESAYTFTIKSDLQPNKLFLGHISNNKVEIQTKEEESNIIDQITTEDAYWSIRSKGSNLYIDAFSFEKVEKFSNKYELINNDIEDNSRNIEVADAYYDKSNNTVWVTGLMEDNTVWAGQLNTDGQFIQKYTFDNDFESTYTNIASTSDTTFVISLANQSKTNLLFANKDSIGVKTMGNARITGLDFNKNILVGGNIGDKHITAGFTIDGEDNFFTTYNKDSLNIEQIPFLTAQDETFTLVGQIFKPNSDDNVMSVFQHNNDGKALCSSDGNLTTTLIKEEKGNIDNSTFEPIDNSTELTTDIINKMNYAAFTAPIVVIEVPECIVQPINVTLEAEITGVPDENLAFKWNTGQTSPIITATKVDEPYILTTTVSYEECYILKDTVTLTESKAPQLSITPSLNADCTFNLQANIDQDGTAPFQYTWSNGNTSPTIFNVEAGNSYNVKVTDKCNLVGNANITPLIPDPDVTLQLNHGDNCTGEITSIINSPIPVTSYLWSTGANTESINITQSGEYSLTVETACTDPVSASINAELDCNLSECLAYPNVFYPEGSETIEKTFGPVIKPGCPDDLSYYENYEFAIYDRWGNEVFKTNDIDKQWDGGDHPNEVYIWYAKFTLSYSGENILRKGDVTLIRKN